MEIRLFNILLKEKPQLYIFWCFLKKKYIRRKYISSVKVDNLSSFGICFKWHIKLMVGRIFNVSSS